MPSRTHKISDKAALPFKAGNKQRRQDLHVRRKKALDALRRAERFGRKKEEAKNPKLREERLRRNVPATLDRKRVYDDVGDEPDNGGLGIAYDVERLKRRKLAEEQNLDGDDTLNGTTQLDRAASEQDEADESDKDSMLDVESSDSEDDEDLSQPDLNLVGPDDPLPTKAQIIQKTKKATQQEARSTSPTRSTTSTNLSLAPAALAAKYPTLFPNPDPDDPSTTPLPTPKVLITTSINSTLHHEAEILTNLIPNSKYIRRSSHRYGYKFSVREISSFASNQSYTSVIVLEEDAKRPSGLTIVHLPSGPTFHFSISNFYEGKSLPGHGRPTSHVPELMLNNFTTPLGLLTAHLFRSLYPPTPDLEGRQVVTFHNQRDFIFLRRFRYVLREKRETEKSVVGIDGKVMHGVEEVRAGLQELGPRLTLKLRRVDRGIQRVSGQDWEWKGKTDRVRTKFQL